MIVTFQVAIYLAYQLWENYISFYLGNTEDSESNDVEHLNSTQNANVDSTLTNSSEPDTANRNVSNRNNEPNITSAPKAGPSSLSDQNESPQQMEEGDGNHHPCLHSVDSLDTCIIENGKPIDETFACNYIKGKEIRFIPPAYTQRYMVIEDVLKEQRWIDVKKVIDFGCSELSFAVKYLKKLVNVNEIVAVDINFEELDYHKCKLVPNAVDFIDPRPTPLAVKIYCGSVGHTNKVLEGAEGVIAIELIEHLYPPDLDCLPFTVFGFIRPKIAMFTTPNAEFNVLLPNFSGIRHWDHKFEWSRQQFEDWGNNIVKRYPDYSVSYRGITPGPPGFEQLGCLSQMATFIKNTSSPLLDEDELHFQEGPYTLVQETTFPYHEDKRTTNEIIRDDAVSFIKKCVMLSRYDESDDGVRKELPLKNIMERIQYFNRKKLIEILTEEKFEIVTNEEGHEMLILPESEDENESYKEDFGDDIFSNSVENNENTYESEPFADENWDDIEWNDHPITLTTTLTDAFISAETKFIEQHNLSQTTVINNYNSCMVENELNVSHDQSLDPNSSTSLGTSKNLSGSDNNHYGSDMSLETTDIDNMIVDDSFYGNLSPESVAPDSLKKLSPQEMNKINKSAELDCSVYKTPFHDWLQSSSKCNFNPSAPSYYNKLSPYGDCRRELDFTSPSESNENQPVSDDTDKSPSCSTNVVCSLESSYYATPCSEMYKNRISKCLSLQDLNDTYNYPTLCVREGGTSLNSSIKEEKKDSVSKSMDGFSQESCDVHETCSNTSRVIDSGYRDSFSDQNIDLNSIQIDDIESQSEGEDLDSPLPSPVEPPEPILPQIMAQAHNVENGDVANNNRDGEGNNMVADMEEDVIEFEAQIEDVDMPNYDVALSRDSGDNYSPSDDLIDASCSHHCTNVCVYNDPLKALSDVGELSHGDKNKTDDQGSIKSTPSDTSFSTKSSWSHIKSLDSISDVKHERQWDLPKSVGHNSLTTVLEGCSRFSNCSLVRPINILTSANNEDSLDSYVFPKWMLSIDDTLFQAKATKIFSCDGLKNLRLNSSQENFSSTSLYQSLDSTPVVSDSEDVSIDFPKWLLEIQLSDAEESSVAGVNSDFSMWDDVSDDIVGFDVQVDARGGGDPQRDSWFD